MFTSKWRPGGFGGAGWWGSCLPAQDAVRQKVVAVSLDFDAVVVPRTAAERYRAAGLWRDETAADDLRRGARLFPDRPALVTRRSGTGVVATMSYGVLDDWVDRFCAALQSLTPPPGVVAYQLPDWWETVALTLACMRLGKVAVPLLVTVREQQLRQALLLTGAEVCVVPQEWDGYPHARVLAALAGDLPRLAHRVVAGDAAATSAVSFAGVFLERYLPGSGQRGVAAGRSGADADRVCLVLFTSGTTGQAKAVLHSHNTVYASGWNSTLEPVGAAGEALVAATTQTISHLAGLSFAVLGPLARGATGVFQDVHDPAGFLDLAAASGATRIFSAPARLFDLIDEQRRRPRPLSALRCVRSGATPVSPRLVASTEGTFGVPLQTTWGMTEVGWATLVPGDAAPRTSGHSDGCPLPGVEIDLADADPATGTGQLRVRGPSVCLATATPAGQLTLTSGHHDGWYLTGDLVRDDGHGGVRLVSRSADRVGGNLLVPIRDVEEELIEHPAITDLALIGIPDERAGEHVCAVIVPANPAAPPTISELSEFLTSRGVTGWHHPTRLEIASTLPRDQHGKVQRATLRTRYQHPGHDDTQAR